MNNLKLINNFVKKVFKVQNKERKTATTYVVFAFFADIEQHI